MRYFLTMVLLALVAGCGGPGSGSPDAGALVDAGVSAGPADSVGEVGRAEMAYSYTGFTAPAGSPGFHWNTPDWSQGECDEFDSSQTCLITGVHQFRQVLRGTGMTDHFGNTLADYQFHSPTGAGLASKIYVGTQPNNHGPVDMRDYSFGTSQDLVFRYADFSDGYAPYAANQAGQEWTKMKHFVHVVCLDATPINDSGDSDMLRCDHWRVDIDPGNIWAAIKVMQDNWGPSPPSSGLNAYQQAVYKSMGYAFMLIAGEHPEAAISDGTEPDECYFLWNGMNDDVMPYCPSQAYWRHVFELENSYNALSGVWELPYNAKSRFENDWAANEPIQYYLWP